MPKNVNPLQSGVVQTASVNNPNVDHMRGRNLFPQSYMHPSTCRYGEVDPVFFMKCERGDVVPYKFVTDLNTHTLASPLKSKVNMMSAAFKVPLQALYPRNYDIILPFPNKGDDVPDDCRALLSPSDLWGDLLDLLADARDNNQFDATCRYVFLLELIFSAGSVFSKANYHFDTRRFSGSVSDSDSFSNVSFDYYFDNYFINWLRAQFRRGVTLTHYDGETYNYRPTDVPAYLGRRWSDDGYYISHRRAVELLRTGEYIISPNDGVTIDFVNFPTLRISGGNMNRLNIEPIIAYKAACVHFFNNPKIDYIFSWELFRDAMQSLVYGDAGLVPTFTWNGVNKQYDVFSGRVMSDAIAGLAWDSHSYFDCTSFWFNLLSFSRSLRYGDYFTGVHPEPLAVGDVNAPITDSSVNTIELVEKLQLTRLLNKVNIAGPRKDDQLVAMYGGPLPEAPKDVPIRLSLEKFDVSGFEVNNTGELQASEDATNITTTNLRLDESRFMFEVSIDEPCWLVAVQYFEAHRIYSRTMDRMAYHRDRLDDFQPDMQYLGDQEVFTQELDAADGTEVAFAYNLRNMEYKQRYSYASGGFIEYLPSWLFITDNKDGNPPQPNITPDYIRSSPSEFDRFYKSLANWSLAGYFHFITTNTNVVAPYRQMIYAPEILA